MRQKPDLKHLEEKRTTDLDRALDGMVELDMIKRFDYSAANDLFTDVDIAAKNVLFIAATRLNKMVEHYRNVTKSHREAMQQIVDDEKQEKKDD